jgi:hypothetical protein
MTWDAAAVAWVSIAMIWGVDRGAMGWRPRPRPAHPSKGNIRAIK